MALGTSNSQSRRARDIAQNGFECRYYTRAIGRKRVLSNGLDELAVNSPYSSSCQKRHCNGKLRPKRSPSLESLPWDVLIRILCCVNHSDLKQLYFVSKMVREATVSARTLHFAFSTPMSKPVFKRAEISEDGKEDEAPNAPKQIRIPKSQFDGKRLGSIVVALFKREGEQWPKGGLFTNA